MKSIKMLILALIVVATTNHAFSQSNTVQTKESTETIIIKVKGADCSEDLKDRKSVVQGKSVDLGGRRIIKKKNNIT